jgi:acetyl/propionyl-CoA carboxylase alpha subunit
VDGGVESGSEVSIHYDPMLAKIVTHGRNRHEAIQRMVRALRASSIQGIRTNRDFLLHVLAHPAFVAGDLDTHFIETHLGDVLGAAADPDLVRRAVLVATLATHEARRGSQPGPAVPSGFRLSRFQDQWVEYEGPLGVTRARYRALSPGRFSVAIDDHATEVTGVRAERDALSFEDGDGVRHTARVIFDGARVYVSSLAGAVALTEVPRFPERRAALVEGACVAPMPGKVIAVEVREGDRVAAGQVLLVMEAMKMEHAVKASEPGVVTAVRVGAGDQVDADQLLAVVDPIG